jgi:glycosyltransferase involved in cell wall biosynthesis
VSRPNELPLVSCVIAVFNGQAYLHEAIDSLLAQDYPHVEIIVVDDGSTDRTADVIQRYGDRLRALSQPNCGVSVARNRGVEMASGRLLCFLDADDLLDPCKITAQVSAIMLNPELDFCDCHTSYFWSPEISAEVLERDPRYLDAFWRKPLPGHISTWMFRRELWERTGRFSDALRYSEDTDWFSRARDTGMRRLTLPEVWTHRRLHSGNVTAQRPVEQVADLTDVLKAHLVRRRMRSPS